MALNILPTEMLAHIFSYFGLDDLCRLTGQVCKTWQLLSYNLKLYRYRTVELNAQAQSPNEIASIMNNSLFCRSFVFSAISDWTNIISVLPKFKTMRMIKFYSCVVNEFDMAQLVTALPSIESVNLKSERIEQCVMEQLVRWEFLKDVIIDTICCAGILDGNYYLNLLSDKCPHLESVTLDSTLSLDDRALLHFARSRGVLLKAFKAGFRNVSTTGYEFLRLCPNLTELYMFSPLNLTGNELLILGELKVLKKLHLSSADNLTAENFVTLFQEFTFLLLTDLRLMSGLDLNDFAVECMSKSCPLLKNLFFLGRKNLTDEGLKHVLINLRYLECLSLCINSRVTGSCFAEIPSEMLSLIRLNVIGCEKINLEELKKLKLAKPNLHICAD